MQYPKKKQKVYKLEVNVTGMSSVKNPTEFFLKVHYCTFENLHVFSNHTLKISQTEFSKISSYLRAKFAFFLKIKLILNILYCLRMFVNKHFTYFGRGYHRK